MRGAWPCSTPSGRSSSAWAPSPPAGGGRGRARLRPLMLHPDRYFDPSPAVRALARELYGRAAGLPLICPHGHVDPRMLAENTPFPDPSALLVIPDHYVTR